MTTITKEEEAAIGLLWRKGWFVRRATAAELERRDAEKIHDKASRRRALILAKITELQDLVNADTKRTGFGRTPFRKKLDCLRFLIDHPDMSVDSAAQASKLPMSTVYRWLLTLSKPEQAKERVDVGQ